MINAKLSMLDDIARGLRALLVKSPDVKLSCIEVRLWDGEDCLLTCYLPTAVEYLANDIHWNEEGDWSSATRATVDTF